MQIFLLKNRTTNGSGDGVLTNFNQPDAEFSVWGTFDGATVQLECSPDGGTTWIAVDGVSLTAPGTIGELEVPKKDTLRATVSGATNPDISAAVRSIYE